MLLYTAKILLILIVIIVSSGLTILGLIYQRQSSKTSRELNIFLPATIKLMLYLWLGLGFITTMFSIVCLILVMFSQKPVI
jgi:hypothetical protein